MSDVAFTRTVNTIKGGTTAVAELCSNDSTGVTICKLSERKSRLHYIVFETCLLQGKSSFEPIVVIAEIAIDNNQLCYVRQSSKYQQLIDSLKEEIRSAIHIDIDTALLKYA